MIASFRQSRFSIVFAALVVAVGLVTLTDASAGERRVVRMKEQVSEPMKEAMKKFETPVNADLKSVSIDDVLHTIMNATGASVVIQDGAIDDETRAKRLNVQANNVPAHLVLFESLGLLNLAVKFTDTGVVVLKVPDEEVVHMRKAEGEVLRSKIRRSEDTPDAEAAVKKIIEVTNETGKGGGSKRKLTVRKDGATEGTLEVELVKEQ